MASLTSGETLRLLLVSANAAMRDEIGEALAGRLGGDHRLYWVSQTDLAQVRANDVLPHIILVDDALDGASPATLIGQLALRLPSAAILALVGPDAMGLARQAVLSGARAFVVKPVHADEFLAALRQVLAAAPRPSGATDDEAVAGRIVVFCAPKGGTGRTTLAINTAISLGKLAQEPVVLVDADYAAPALDVALNLDSEYTIADLLPKLAHLDRDLVTSSLVSHISGLRVLLAPPPAALTSAISLPQVQQVLAWLKRMFPWVLVDLGLPLDETAFAFLDGADRIVMSVLPEMVGLRNVRLMLDQLRDRGYPEEKVWLVLNRATIRGGVSQADIEEQLHVKTTWRIPDDQPLATHSINRGVPFVLSHPHAAASRATKDFAKHLQQAMSTRVPQVAEQEKARGLLGIRRRTAASVN